MSVSFPWVVFRMESILIVLALGVLILDLFLKKENRGNILANTAMAGVTLSFSVLSLGWGQFGHAFNLSFIQDGVSSCFKSILLISAFFTLFMAREYQSEMKRGRSEFIMLILFALIGSVFLVSANDFITFFVALETMSISLYIMTAYLRDSEASIEAGVKYLILGALSTAIFLYGLSFVYGAARSTNYFEIHQIMLEWKTIPASFVFGMILVIASLGFKIAAVPFQLWVPDIYQGAPTPVTAFLATASKTAGFAALLRLVLTVFEPVSHLTGPLFAGLAALTILYGNLGAIPQTNIKRLLGFSSIGHAGYLLIGLAALQNSGKEAILFYLLSYVFSTAGVFLVLIGARSMMQSQNIQDLAGLSKRSPMLAAAMLVSLMSLAGVPPLSGFFAKFYLLWACVKEGYLWLVVIGVLNVVTSLYYYLKVVKVIYVDEPVNPEPLHVSFDQRVIQLFVVLGIVCMGVFQGPFVRIAQSAFALFIQS